MAEYSEDFLKETLTRARIIAMVGLSPDPVRPSQFVARYLQLRGKRIVPVNPRHAGKRILGQPVYPDLASIPGDAAVDMVDIFRRSEEVPSIVEAALDHLPALQTVWMQIGVENAEAAARAEAAGKRVIQNRCPKIEHQRLFGELRMGGFATGIISSRL
ncbi:putative CoA-binding protein [Rhodovulum iodosum]|uniref:CoA-binding protein n=1 Tax=Rhodovulum iodosum TaxID=68291 RepID=A0ABV3XPP4_9RHOB|nr:CoA-binding protein [Rhodovulum robiginosum]RSK38014.1 CoA-binding protein [Rhodovulum robiginosum]